MPVDGLKSVLVADDEPGVRMLLVRMLARQGYAAIPAADGSEALRHLSAGRPIDLLVTDLGLPGGLNGCQLAAEARRVMPGLKVLFITGDADAALIGDAARTADTPVMRKPFQMSALAVTVRTMIGVGTPTP